MPGALAAHCSPRVTFRNLKLSERGVDPRALHFKEIDKEENATQILLC